jgi:hypothetical protein
MDKQQRQKFLPEVRERAVRMVIEHQDGDGYNVVLQALPIDGKIVLRLPKDEKADQQPQERTVQNNKSGSRRR